MTVSEHLTHGLTPAGKNQAKDSETLVLVALSGGVDSAVVLNYLQERYTQVEGISHRHWPESKCCTTACIDTCRSQCNDLGIPYQTIDTLVEFAENIVDPFVTAYRQGTTPNPCVICNEKNRFGLMLEKYLKEKNIPPNSPWKIATGHYARIELVNDRFVLKRGVDSEKDQSYMLYRLSQEQLSHCLFPLGHVTKPKVREAAEEFQLESAKKMDSQDICFVENDYREFLHNYGGEKELPGEFIDKQGNVLASHKGISHYNRGQRKGIGLSGGPWYVIKINQGDRSIVLGSKKDLEINTFTLSDCVWNLSEDFQTMECEVQVRYHGKVHPCNVEKSGPDTYKVHLGTPTVDLSAGQSAVFYHGDTLLGGGIINNDF